MTTQRVPRCWYCDSLVADKDAMIVLSTGSVYGPCCRDLFTPKGEGIVTKTEIAMGTCPVCQGTARKPVPESSQRYIKHNARWGHWGIAGYEPSGPGPFVDGQGYEGGTLPCGNCGGQTMSSTGTGKVPLRADGTPCHHETVTTKLGNCYHEYQCKHCSFRYCIDSGD